MSTDNALNALTARIRAFVTLFAKGTASMQQASAEEVQRMLDEIFNG